MSFDDSNTMMNKTNEGRNKIRRHTRINALKPCKIKRRKYNNKLKV